MECQKHTDPQEHYKEDLAWDRGYSVGFDEGRASKIKFFERSNKGIREKEYSDESINCIAELVLFLINVCDRFPQTDFFKCEDIIDLLRKNHVSNKTINFIIKNGVDFNLRNKMQRFYRIQIDDTNYKKYGLIKRGKK